ncbi:MAG TPA: helix-turn-helix transcriptional regulator [Ktedonobacteraceae bacterium]|nr:helix-turn-helix transcriptional regulator [Ktedonobacteraceae bacterium]
MLEVKSRLSELELSRLGTQEAHQVAVERVVRVLKSQVQDVLSLEDMADIACLSPYYFSRIFHSIIGIPPGEFLATLRLDRAKRLLLTTSLSVTDICFEVGYSSLGSFTTRFTQLVGVSPRQLRHRAKHVPLPFFIAEQDITTKAPLAIAGPAGLAGQVHATGVLSALIFIGLFRKPIPQGRPVRCTMLYAPGPYAIHAIPDGCYYVMVAAFPFPGSEDPQTCILPYEKLLVGTQGPVIVHQGMAKAPVNVVLHPPRLTDPPLIIGLPYL